MEEIKACLSDVVSTGFFNLVFVVRSSVLHFLSLHKVTQVTCGAFLFEDKGIMKSYLDPI